MQTKWPRNRLSLALLASSFWLLCASEAAPRSRQVRAEFHRLVPCPSTGAHRGACPGFEIDHIHALCAGGKDDLENLQWLAKADHAAKTRKDVAACFQRAYKP